MTSMSLRGRLLLATGVLVALGLLVADGATYGLLRRSLVSRVDAQLVQLLDGEATVLGCQIGRASCRERVYSNV